MERDAASSSCIISQIRQLSSNPPTLPAKRRGSPGGEAAIFLFFRLRARLQAVGINPAHCSVPSSWKRKAPKNHFDVERWPIIKKKKKKEVGRNRRCRDPRRG